MTSKNKKNKAKNSYLHNGGEKSREGRLKRIYYYSKAERHEFKNFTKRIEVEEAE